MFYWKKWFGVGQSKWILERHGVYPSREIAKVDLSTNHHQHGVPQPPVSTDFTPVRDFYRSYDDDRGQQFARIGHPTAAHNASRSEYLNSSVSSHASSDMAKAFQHRERMHTTTSGGSNIPAGYRGSAV
uniref:Zasp-like motif domain-containing protein n=1 Tax=Trichuris muris TaxID=70415 RepID=A0A5S6Q159_TRIMR